MAAPARTERDEPVALPAPPLLLPRVALGDERAVKECLNRYGRLVHSLAWRYSVDRHEVDDACQDIFIALWKSAASFDPARGGEATFVALVARRRLIDRARAAGARAVPPPEEAPVPSAAALEDYVDARNAVAALEGCSEEQRRVILLSAFEGLTHEEIAGRLGLPLGTVKSHYARGIDRVKRALRSGEVPR